MKNSDQNSKHSIKCPDCGKEFLQETNPETVNKSAVKILSFISVLLAAGLIAMLVYVNGEKPVTGTKTISDVIQQGNNVFMHLTGKVSGQPVYDTAKKRFTFILDDGSASVEVRSPEEVLKELIKMGNIPVVGFSVGVRGNVVFQDGGVFMELKGPDNLFIRERPVISLVSTDEIRKENLGAGIRFRAVVEKVTNEIHFSHIEARCSKSRKNIRTIVPGYFEIFAQKSVKLNEEYEFTGLLTEFNNELCVLLFSANSIKPVSGQDIPKEVPQQMDIVIEQTKDFGEKGILFVSKDRKTGKKINAVLWKTNGKNPDYVPGPGDILNCSGILKQYKGDSEYTISSFNVEHVDFNSVTKSQISEIGNHVGRFVRTMGKIKKKTDQQSRFEIVLSDESTDMEVTLNIKIADFIKIRNNGLIFPGSRLEFVGKVMSKKDMNLFNPESTVVTKAK